MTGFDPDEFKERVSSKAAAAIMWFVLAVAAAVVVGLLALIGKAVF